MTLTPIKPLPSAWLPLARELETLHAELPRLLAEGKEGQFVVIKGDRVYATRPSYGEASDFGHDHFDDGRFMAQQVEASFLTVLDEYFGRAGASGAA